MLTNTFLNKITALFCIIVLIYCFYFVNFKEFNIYQYQDQREWTVVNNQIILNNNSTKIKSSQVWPIKNITNDRIIEQILFTPDSDDEELKIIFVYNPETLTYLNYKTGQQSFENCPIKSCSITNNKHDAKKATAVIFNFGMHFASTPYEFKLNKFWNRSDDQVWIFFSTEGPYYSTNFTRYSNNIFNWTISYRPDSDIPNPYDKWIYYDDNIKQNDLNIINYAANKTKKVAWFVSNCGGRNERIAYAKELAKYISVDIYGACGTMKCNRKNANECFQLLQNNYKFYLAFENSNCIYYITEKLYRNSLRNSVIPIVMGARPEDYEKLAPYKSYIHVDDFNSLKELADYLDILDKNDNLYNEYFKWIGTGEFILDTKLWCRLCKMLNDQNKPRKSYDNLQEWWKGKDVCISHGPWSKKSN